MARKIQAPRGRKLDPKPDRAKGQRPSAVPLEPDLSLVSWRDAERVFRVVREFLVPVDQPLVLISQTQRSGGTLMNTLLDGHPELHVHPYELHTGHPTKYDWPVLDPASDADTWLAMLGEEILERLFSAGYRKKPGMEDLQDHPILPFTLAPSFLARLFRVVCAENPPSSQREIFDRYFTSFFNAWIDYQGLRDTPKKWTAAFGPRLVWGENRRRFLADYADGRIVAIHRDPRSWYSSASRFSRRYGEFAEALALWQRGAEEIRAAKAETPELVFVLTFEGLVSDPERVMATLADWLGIEWNPILLVPTFNRQRTVPNSSYSLKETGIAQEPLERWREVLSVETVATIESQALELDAAVREIADVA
jgi:hypothetical protein